MMNDNVKNILRDLICYCNDVPTENSPSAKLLEGLSQRAARELMLETMKTHAETKSDDENPQGVDPFSMENPQYSGQEYGGFPEPPMKHEEDW